MAQATRRATPAPKSQPAKTAPRPAATPSKASRAAAAQGRPEPEKRPTPAPQRTAVPATVKKTELADPASLAKLPAFMREDAGMGKENIDRSDIETPRLKLMQGISDELTEYNELRAGNFFHTAAEHIFDQAFLAVPIFLDKQYILWNPLENGGGILARSPDAIHWSPSHGEFNVKLDKKDGGHNVTWRLAETVAQSGLANWGTMNPADPNSPPAATLMYNFVFAFPDFPDLMPAALTFQRSSIKQGRKLNTKLKTVRTPLFGSVFQISAYEDNNSVGQTFYNINATGAGLVGVDVGDEALYNMYRDMHMSLREQGLQIKDLESAQTEEGSAGTDDPNAPKY